MAQKKTTTSSAKKTTSTKKTAAAPKAVVAAEPVEIVEEKVAEKKTYQPDDFIVCKSLVSGGLYITGERSKALYTFADYGDETEIEYQDLLYMIRSKDKSVYEPRIIITDSELVAQYPEVHAIYDALYSVEDLKEIVKLDARQMEAVIKLLPNGAVEALKGIVSTMIDNHTLDSVIKIKALDKILGTNLLLGLAQN